MFATNKTDESSGKWVDICVNADGTTCRFRLARAGRRNKSYAKAMEKATKPYRAILNELDAKTDDKITATALSEAVILDWENTQLEEGVNVPYSKQAAFDLLVSLPDLCDMVNKLAWDQNTFREERLEDDAKN
jgi:hypothetical protein